ncbi:MAG: hypothetical protein LBH56_02955, partial [Coriobacteriales bacterium]|nr:hypothetical protein [Coriobacteriales bacterium]
PYATFVPIGEDFEFSEGKEIDVRLRVFGFLDLGLHHIRIWKFDEEAGEILSNEYDKVVPVWNHRIVVKESGESESFYTDEVEIEAGWRTPMIALWSRAFYRHRQRRWRKIANAVSRGRIS